MPKSGKNVEFIFTASEIATYVYCPKAWELKYLKKKEPHEKPNFKSEKIQHQVWLRNFDMARKFTWASRAILFMIIFLIIFYLFIKFDFS